MRKLFIQFYLLLVFSFLVAVSLAGLVYKTVAEKAGDRALADLLQTTLTLIEHTLDDTPEAQWPAELAKLDHELDFNVALKPLQSLPLDKKAMQSLADGDIVMLESELLYLQRIKDSQYALVAGPMNYLVFMHELKWLDYALLTMIGLSLAIPVLVWMRPHWNELVQLENAAKQLSQGQFEARVSLSTTSGLQPLATGFNHMAQSVERLLESKQTLINAVAHELRTPLARLRYRMALLDADAASTVSEGIERDLSSIGSLIDELLLHARLGRPDLPMQPALLPAEAWLRQRLDDLTSHHPQLQVRLFNYHDTLYGDDTLLARALDNLLINAARYGQGEIALSFGIVNGEQQLSVADNGKGIAETDRSRVMEPFVRLDPSREKGQGGYGLGLAIVQQIMLAHHGRVEIDHSPLGGACFRLCWPP
jgi:two-component system sensor histidine kinase RstB